MQLPDPALMKDLPQLLAVLSGCSLHLPATWGLPQLQSHLGRDPALPGALHIQRWIKGGV